MALADFHTHIFRQGLPQGLTSSYALPLQNTRSPNLTSYRDPLWISRVKRGASRGDRTKPPPSSPPPRRARGQALTPRRQRESIRQLAEQLFKRPQLGRDVFQRGQPEPIAEIKQYEWSATLYELLSAYAAAANLIPDTGPSAPPSNARSARICCKAELEDDLRQAEATSCLPSLPLLRRRRASADR
jgi:hypothetical protein